MRYVRFDGTFDGWRAAARELLLAGVQPDNVAWMSDSSQGALFTSTTEGLGTTGSIELPSSFFDLAKVASVFDDPSRWSTLYRIAFRLAYENRSLLSIESDADIRQLHLMAKGVRRDIHKFHAFVRFRRVECDGKEIFVAWHEPQHFTVELATPFFARRFGSMHFSILTPKGCAHWDRTELTFSAPAERSQAPSADETEDFWLLYYRSIFNPFRLKVKTMKRELPVRHWPTLPEAVLIPELIQNASTERGIRKDECA
jgi:probable DNA metabolism protein